MNGHVPCDVPNKPNYDLISNLSMVCFPTFEGHPWEYAHNYLDKNVAFCESISVYDALTSSCIFPITLSVEETHLYPCHLT